MSEGERASVTCTIRSGDKPIEFQWKKDNQALKEGTNVEIQSLRDSSIMVIESVTAKSSGNYTCVVTNSKGKDQFTASLTVTGEYCILKKIILWPITYWLTMNLFLNYQAKNHWRLFRHIWLTYNLINYS